MIFFASKHSKTNGIISITLFFVALILLIASKISTSFIDVMYVVLTCDAFYFINFLLTLNIEKKEKLRNKEFEKINNISNSVLDEDFYAEVIEYIPTNSFNLPGFVINIKSGCINVGDKILLPDGTKTHITNIFFPQNRPITSKAYSGETVKIILYSIRDDKKLSVGMNLKK